MPSLAKHEQTAPEHWRSLAELADAPEFRKFLDNEFPEVEAGQNGSVSRRRFMQLMGASLALAGGACRWQEEKILPLSRRPEGHVPGLPTQFATAMELGGVATGYLVSSYDGRPVKVEGNPAHPSSLGATDGFAQAAVLELYDPERSQSPVQMRNGRAYRKTWTEADAALANVRQDAMADGGRGLRVLSEASSSPTLARLRKAFARQFPQAQWVTYEPWARDAERLGTKMAFGRALKPQLRLQAARVLVALDDDLFRDHPTALANSRHFAAARKPVQGKMNRLYAVESRYSTTGGMADHRLPVRAEQVLPFVLLLTAAVAKRLNVGAPSAASRFALSPKPGFFSAAETGRFIGALADDLVANKGAALLTAGPGQSAETHAWVAQLNHLLGATGRTVVYTEAPEADAPSGQQALVQLVQDIEQGRVTGLVMLGGNPVYDAPANVPFTKALGRLKHALHLSVYQNETSRAAGWHLPMAHSLERWGDVRAQDGTVSIAQPLIKPLHGGRSSIEVVARLLGRRGADGQKLVRQTWNNLVGAAGGAVNWRKALRDGVVANTASPAVTPTLQRLPNVQVSTSQLRAGDDVQNGALELVFWDDSSVHDGRFANSAWLQEQPDFMTKVSWDNMAVMGPATAKALGVKNSELVTLKLGDRQLSLPVYVLPGQARGSVAVTLGYGRTAAGVVGGDTSKDVAPVGVSVYPLRDAANQNFVSGLTVTGTGREYKLATTQDHHAIDNIGKQGIERRLGDLVREATLSDFTKEPDFAKHKVHHPPLLSLFQERDQQSIENRWGMSIDLTACVGCNACQLACQAENNIPVVGKDQVYNGREMHWIRVDRYFKGDEENPQLVQQPVTCQHCENAPCEQVCPVAATVHSSEGLNDMVYNRCVGTRYCSNNCPYKVRRFNFFNYHEALKEPNTDLQKMVFNPEVTVRARGVMEKCTFCVQRIQATKIDAKNNRRPIQDGEVVPACAQACPTDAIKFGNLNDKRSEVAQAHADPRAYFMLSELNIKPRTAYLARIRNPNPELAA